MSRYPFYDYFSEILDDLYTAAKHHLINTVEAYINKLVLECPAPPRGLAKVKYEKYSRPGKYLELTQPPINELPYVNRSFFDCLFRTLPVEDIVAVFTHLLVERSVSVLMFNLLGFDSIAFSGELSSNNPEFDKPDSPLRMDDLHPLH